MKAAEHQALRRVEEDHWFYCGKREIVMRWLQRLEDREILSDGRGILLDVGCGSGALVERVNVSRTMVGVENSWEALKSPRDGARGKVVQASSDRLPFRDGAIEAVTSLDVLEHIEDDDGALREWLRVIHSRGGVLLLNVPAYPWLYGDWDRSLGHYRRYERSHLRALLRKTGYTVGHLSNENLVGLLAAVIVRGLRRLGGRRFLALEHRVPPTWLNRLLKWCYVWPSRGLSRWVPMGLSLWVVATKPAPKVP